MSEALIGLIGVVIGGFIATIGQCITSFFNYKKWKKEIRIQHLRLKRNKLEKAFAETKERLIKGVINNLYDIDMLTDFDAFFPKKVFQSFEEMIKEKPRRDKEKREHLYKIMRSMKESLTEIDKEIDKEIK